MAQSAAHNATMATYAPVLNAEGQRVNVSQTVPNAEDFREHVRTYHYFVLGFGLFAAHVLAILILLYLFLM